jgi:hypothetical protein
MNFNQVSARDTIRYSLTFLGVSSLGRKLAESEIESLIECVDGDMLTLKDAGTTIDLSDLLNRLNVENERLAARDQHGRTSFDSLETSGNAVDEAVLRFKRGIRLGKSSEMRPEVMLTHDVDRTHFFDVSHIVGTAVKSISNPGRLFDLKKIFRPHSDVIRRFSKILDLECRHGANSTYFFLCEPYRLRRYNSRYSFDYRSLPGIFEIIRDAGSTIGLHGSYYSYDTADYADERARLEGIAETKIVSNRNHYLRMDPFKTPAGLAKSGIALDSSLGYAHINGFRNTSSFPFIWYSTYGQEQKPLLEVPMVYMDTVGLGRNDDMASAVEEITRILQRVKDTNGCVSLLFHYDIISESKLWFDIYERVLKSCATEGFRFITEEELLKRYEITT